MDKSLADAVQQEIATWSVQDAARGRYPALRTIAGALHVLSVVVFIVGLVGVGAIIVMGFHSPRQTLVDAAVLVGLALGVGLVTFCFAIMLRAFSELINVAVDVEKNTRDLLDALKK